MTDLNRRHFLAGLTAVLGVSGVVYLNDNAIEVGATYKPSGKNEFFNDDHMKLAARFVDIIIPDTDTPGAAKASVHLYIDHMAGAWMTEDESAVILEGLDNLDAAAKKGHGKSFLSLDDAYQVAIVQNMDDNRETNQAYNALKAYTVTGYYTSKIGATQELYYDPYPGSYREVLFKDIGRASAT